MNVDAIWFVLLSRGSPQALERQVQEFPELLRLERTAAGLQVEELHSRAVSAFTNKSSELERRLQEEQKRADAAECELRAAQERCSLVESQLKSSNESLLELQSQLSKSDSNWRRELDAVQQLLQDQALTAESLNRQLQAQVSRADEATAKCRQAEAEVEQLRHAMRLDADRMQVSMWRIAQCVSCDLPVLWRVCLVVHVCGRARVCVCAHLLFMGW